MFNEALEIKGKLYKILKTLVLVPYPDGRVLLQECDDFQRRRHDIKKVYYYVVHHNNDTIKEYWVKWYYNPAQVKFEFESTQKVVKIAVSHKNIEVRSVKAIAYDGHSLLMEYIDYTVYLPLYYYLHEKNTLQFTDTERRYIRIAIMKWLNEVKLTIGQLLYDFSTRNTLICRKNGKISIIMIDFEKVSEGTCMKKQWLNTLNEIFPEKNDDWERN